MIVYTPERDFNADSKSCAVALGNFDGVHSGHASVISGMTQYAKSKSLASLVYTFLTHPSQYFSHGTRNLITDNSEKTRAFEEIGADMAYFDDFCKVKDFSPREFCEKVLIQKFRAKAVFCGENYRFGKGGNGDVRALREILTPLGVEVFVCGFVTDSDNEVVSSTRIRSLLSQGLTEKAGELLTRPFSISGEVIHGRELGRVLGFPTLNQLYPKGKLLLPFGVYAAMCEIDGKTYAGVANVGVKPTVSSDANSPILCETHLIDYFGDAYGKDVRVSFYKMLRPEKKFASLEQLKIEVHQNITQTKEYFKEKGYVFEK